MREMNDKAAKSEEVASSKNSLAQLGAKTELLKAFFSSVTSDKELRAFEGAGGKVNQLQTELNQWVANGQIPADFMNRVQDVARSTRKYSDQKMRERGKLTRKRIEMDPRLRRALSKEELTDWANLGESVWLEGGEMPEDAPVEQRSAPKGKPAPAGAASADSEVEDLL